MDSVAQSYHARVNRRGPGDKMQQSGYGQDFTTCLLEMFSGEQEDWMDLCSMKWAEARTQVQVSRQHSSSCQTTIRQGLVWQT